MNIYYFDFHPKHKLKDYYITVIAENIEVAKAAVKEFLGYLPYDWYDKRDQEHDLNIYKKGCFASIKQRQDENSRGFN